MIDQLISFETAKLAKEKGFDILINTLYQLDGILHTVSPSDRYPHLKVHRNKEIDSYTNGFLNWNNLNVDEDEKLDLFSGFNEMSENPFSVCCSAPTQSLLQKWLREEHNIHIQLHYDCKYKYWEFRNFILSKYIDKEHNKVYFECIGYNTYEEALEAGLQEALKLI